MLKNSIPLVNLHFDLEMIILRIDVCIIYFNQMSIQKKMYLHKLIGIIPLYSNVLLDLHHIFFRCQIH